MSENKEQEARVAEILAESEIKTVTDQTISIYFEYLKGALALPCDVVVTGEDENYLLQEIQDSGDDLYGILGLVNQAGNDTKTTLFPLCDIQDVDNRSHNARLLSDYAYWFVNAQ